MARPRPGFHSTIEYIGPRPQKPKRRHFFGGWVILLAGVLAFVVALATISLQAVRAALANPVKSLRSE